MITEKSKLGIASTSELIACVNEIKNGKIPTKDIKDVLGTDYDYSALTNELTKRGCVNTWIDPSEMTRNTVELEVDISEETSRTTYAVTKSVQKRYNKFLKDKKIKAAYTSAALTYFMDAIESGDLKIKTIL